MTTARAGALTTNAGRAADGDQLDPTFFDSSSSIQALRFKLFDSSSSIQALRSKLCDPSSAIQALRSKLSDSSSPIQEFADKSDQQQYLTLLREQMKYTLDLDEQTSVDTAVEITVIKMHHIRQNKHTLQSMNDRTHDRTPEQSSLMMEHWREMREQEATLGSQEMLPDSEDTQSKSDSDYEDTRSDPDSESTLTQ
jgi:hypothetical protein